MRGRSSRRHSRHIFLFESWTTCWQPHHCFNCYISSTETNGITDVPVSEVLRVQETFYKMPTTRWNGNVVRNFLTYISTPFRPGTYSARFCWLQNFSLDSHVYVPGAYNFSESGLVDILRLRFAFRLESDNQVRFQHFSPTQIVLTSTHGALESAGTSCVHTQFTRTLWVQDWRRTFSDTLKPSFSAVAIHIRQNISSLMSKRHFRIP